VALAFGSWMVARPVRALTAMSDRIARGDLSARLELRQHDELATLARSLNYMATQLEAAMAQVRHADRLATVGTLAAGVAHELGTPLNVAGGTARAIATKEVSGDEALEAARTIEEQTRNMSGIIRQLLDFARRRPPQKEVTNVSDLAARTLEMVRPLSEKRGVVLVFAGGDDSSAEVDEGQIGQAITNLVMNGVQAMPSGGRLSVRVTTARLRPPVDVGPEERDFVQIAVHDEGAGIAADVLPHVFEPFFTTKRVGEGTGLGLSVSYGLVREHGGWISVESAPDRGATFTIHLPRGS
jgi:signal transduction histidine kinase